MLNWRLNLGELGGILDHARPRLVIVYIDFVGALRDQLARLDAQVPSTQTLSSPVRCRSRIC